MSQDGSGPASAGPSHVLLALVSRYFLVAGLSIVGGFVRALHVTSQRIDKVVVAPLHEEAFKIFVLFLVVDLVSLRSRAGLRLSQVGIVAVFAVLFSIVEHVSTYPSESALVFLMRVSVHVAAPILGMAVRGQGAGATYRWLLLAFVVHACYNALPNLALQAAFALLAAVATAVVVVRRRDLLENAPPLWSGVRA